MSLREQLLIVADELIRLKAEGVTAIPVSDATIAALQNSSKPAGANLPREPAVPVASVQRSAPAGREMPVIVGKPALPAKPKTTETAPPSELTLPQGSKREQFEWLVAHVTGHPDCIAHVRPGKKAVVGVGNLDATIMFVGEAPGAEEEIQGEPFVGPAGQLLNKMIRAMGVERGDVYIGNIMNWRPEVPTPDGREQIGNRPPTAEEMAFCLPFLRAQVAIVKPRVLVALGATAAKGLLGADAVPTLGSVKGRWHDFGGTPLMITYHPSYLLRSHSPRAKRSVWEDLLLVMERVGLPISAKQRGFFL